VVLCPQIFLGKAKNTMTTYEIIDTICDAINPALFLGLVGLMGYQLYKKQFAVVGVLSFELLLGLVIAYGIRHLDVQFKIWEGFGSDYSTHTAVCLALLLVLCHAVGYIKLFIGLFVVYFILMLYQEYHTVLDIVSTSLALAPLFVGLHFLSRTLFTTASSPVLIKIPT